MVILGIRYSWGGRRYMSFSRDGRGSKQGKTPEQEWQAFLDDLGKRKPQPPAFYPALKESSFGSITNESLTIYFPSEELKNEANKLRPKIQSALPLELKRDKVFCQVGTAPQKTVVSTSVNKSFRPAGQPTPNQPSRGVSSTAIKSPLQALNFASFGVDNKNNELAQPVLTSAVDADDTCKELYTKLAKRTRNLAQDGIVLTVQFPWRLRVGGLRGFRELLLPAFHPVYGVPYIPASSLKGAARAWARRNGEELQADKLLGTLEKGIGLVQILDAFPTGPSLSIDMANPQWSWQNGQVKYGPVPHPLLTMEQPELVIGILPTSRGQQKDVEVAKEWLEEALKGGIGSRVSAGYGRTKLGAGLSHSRTYDFKLWSQGIYGASPPSKENDWQGTLEFRPVALRGVLRYWFRAIALGIYAPDEVQILEDKLFGALGKQGNLSIGVEWQEGKGNSPYFYSGKILLEAKGSQQELELIEKILFLASLLGGLGRGSRRPLHLLDRRMRGCHWEVMGSILPLSKEDWQKFLGQAHQAFLNLQKPTSKPGDGNPGEGARNRRNQDVLNRNTQICLMPSENLTHPQDVSDWRREGDKLSVRGEALELLYSSEKYKGSNRNGQGNPNVGGTLEAPSFVLIQSNFPEQGQPYQAVTIFGADHKDRAEFARVLVEDGAMQVWPL
jgi:CRISPR-associated protein Cmr6